jgi:hypothetical protein
MSSGHFWAFQSVTDPFKWGFWCPEAPELFAQALRGKRSPATTPSVLVRFLVLSIVLPFSWGLYIILTAMAGLARVEDRRFSVASAPRLTCRSLCAPDSTGLASSFHAGRTCHGGFILPDPAREPSPAPCGLGRSKGHAGENAQHASAASPAPPQQCHAAARRRAIHARVVGE